MDPLTIILTVLSFMGAVCLKLLLGELQDWMPILARRLIERLPQSDQNRYREEWYAHLDDCPGKLGKLWHAAGCNMGAPAVAVSLKKSLRQVRSIESHSNVHPNGHKLTKSQEVSRLTEEKIKRVDEFDFRLVVHVDETGAESADARSVIAIQCKNLIEQNRDFRHVSQLIQEYRNAYDYAIEVQNAMRLQQELNKIRNFTDEYRKILTFVGGYRKGRT